MHAPLPKLTDLSTKLATCLKSSSVNPLEVRAGAPMRTPPGIRADVSPAQSPIQSALMPFAITMNLSKKQRHARVPMQQHAGMQPVYVPSLPSPQLVHDEAQSLTSFQVLSHQVQTADPRDCPVTAAATGLRQQSEAWSCWHFGNGKARQGFSLSVSVGQLLAGVPAAALALQLV